jgi:GntR family transcriptional regulator
MLAGFHEDTRARGLVPSARTKNVEWVVPPAPVATRLGIEQGKRAVLIERVLLANGEPIGMQRSVLPEDALGEGGLFTKYELDNGSLYALLEERSGASPRRATQVVGATLASGELATLLDVGDGAPLLKLERLCFDQADRPIELVDLWYRADRYRLSVEMMGSTR